MARSVVHTCGHLKFGATALTSNDCARVDESWGEPLGRNGPLGYSNVSAPGLEITFPIHTNGTRPVKMPVPPRTCVCRSPTAFQLNPTRGANNGLARSEEHTSELQSRNDISY